MLTKAAEVNIKPAEFWDMTPAELGAFIDGRNKVIEFEQRRQWERTRWMTWWLINIQLPKNKKIEILDLLTFPDEILDITPEAEAQGINLLKRIEKNYKAN